MEEDVLKLLARFREGLQALTLDFQLIKDITFKLYKENGELMQDNENLKKLLFAKQETENKEDEPEIGAGYANLAHLYSEGFHICHLNFAEKRKGDCLFCQKLLEGPER